MILNKAEPQVKEKLRNELAGSPVAQAVCEAIDQVPDPFEVVADTSGFEVRAPAFLPTGLPNRARLKIFSPRPGHTLVFFYKRSIVPYSRDRYSYGGIDLREGRADPPEIAEWITFVTSGFHPDKRPVNMRRAFPYEIPE